MGVGAPSQATLLDLKIGNSSCISCVFIMSLYDHGISIRYQAGGAYSFFFFPFVSTKLQAEAILLYFDSRIPQF